MMIKTVNCEIITVPLANAIVHGAANKRLQLIGYS